MPIKKASKKDLRKAYKSRQRNLKRQQTIKDFRKKILKALTAKDTAQLAELMRQAQQAIDKAAKSGAIKKNSANRKKARLAAQVRKIVKK